MSGQENPCSKIVGQIHAHAKLTSKWGGHVGTDRSIRWVRHVDRHLLYSHTKTLNLRMFGMFISFFSVGEWSPLLQTCSGLLFFGTERFLAHLPPARLAPLSLQGSIYHVATEWLIHKSVIRSMSLHFFYQRCGSEMT